MSGIADVLERRARSLPGQVVFEDSARRVDAAVALQAVDAVAMLLGRGAAPARALSQLDNGVDAILLDLAVRRAGGVHIALPTYFHPIQASHAIRDCEPDWLARGHGAAAPGPAWMPVPQAWLPTVTLWRRTAESGDTVRLPPTTAVVTYTSGSTGEPRGVCLGEPALLRVAMALAEAFAEQDPRRHLCALPLATLLETVGVYAALLRGASIVAPPLAALGYSGASALCAGVLYRTFARHRPHSAILVPQLLEGLLTAIEDQGGLPEPPRVLAVGGARVGSALLARAARCGLPVFEGYGLTEAASVVTLNRPGAVRPGSAGRPLPHLQLSVAADGEIWIRGQGSLGYVGGPLPAAAAADAAWPTGDLGWLDDDGYLHLQGRRRNMFVTAFGRNVTPEWIESELAAQPAIVQAVVTGEARPWNLALVVPAGPTTSDAELRAGITAANARLPDYARIAAFLRVDGPFSAANGLATGNGRPRRDAVLARYAAPVARRFAAAPDPLLHFASEATA